MYVGICNETFVLEYCIAMTAPLSGGHDAASSQEHMSQWEAFRFVPIAVPAPNESLFVL